MGRLAEKMIRLKTEVDRLKKDRHSFIHQVKNDRIRLKSDVSDLTGRFAADRRKRYLEVRKELSSFRSGLSSYVGELGQEVSDLRIQFESEMNDIRQQREERSAGVGTIRDEVCDLLEASRQKRLKIAARLRKNLTSFRYRIIEQVRELSTTDTPQRIAVVAELKKEVSEMRGSFRQELTETAQKGQENRTAFMAEVRSSVSEMMQGVTDFRNDLITDLNEIRRVWQGEMSQPVTDDPIAEPEFVEEERWENERDPDPVPEPEPVPEFEPESEPAPVSETPPVKDSAIETESLPDLKPESNLFDDSAVDDLTLISGVGPERKRKLNNAGIRTFSQLAECDPETLYDIMNRRVGPDLINKWIDQAKELNI